METTTSNSSAAVGGPSYLCRGVFDALSFFIIAQHLSKLSIPPPKAALRKTR